MAAEDTATTAAGADRDPATGAEVLREGQSGEEEKERERPVLQKTGEEMIQHQPEPQIQHHPEQELSKVSITILRCSK